MTTKNYDLCLSECPKKWQSLKLNSVSGCYKFVNQSKGWQDAEQSCQDMGGHLASVTSADEQTMVFQVSVTLPEYMIISVTLIIKNFIIFIIFSILPKINLEDLLYESIHLLELVI